MSPCYDGSWAARASSGNDVLALNELRYERGEKRLGYSAIRQYLVYLKDAHPFLREAHSQPLQQTLKDLARAYQRAFDPKLATRLPSFKKRGRPFGIRFPQGFRVDGQGIYLPKVGWLRFRKSREIEGEIKNLTLSFDGRNWYAPSKRSVRSKRRLTHRRARPASTWAWRSSRRFRTGRSSTAPTPSRRTRSAWRCCSGG